MFGRFCTNSSASFGVLSWRCCERLSSNHPFYSVQVTPEQIKRMWSRGKPTTAYTGWKWMDFLHYDSLCFRYRVSSPVRLQASSVGHIILRPVQTPFVRSCHTQTNRFGLQLVEHMPRQMRRILLQPFYTVKQSHDSLDHLVFQAVWSRYVFTGCDLFVPQQMTIGNTESHIGPTKLARMGHSFTSE